MRFQIALEPPVINVVTLNTRRGRRVAHLAQHLSDLKFVAECLAELRKLPAEPTTAGEAIWRSAIVSYIKCFSAPEREGGRSQLDAAKLIPAGQLRVDHKFFLNVRNTQVAHDEGSRELIFALALVSQVEGQHHVGPLAFPHLQTSTYGRENFDRLEALITHCHERVRVEHETLSNKIVQWLGQNFRGSDLATREEIRDDEEPSA